MKETKVVFPEDDEAASLQTVTGWVSRAGNFWGKDERAARYDGSTHYRCECGNIVPKMSYCWECSEKRQIEKYIAMPKTAWDGVSMLYSLARDTYYSTIDDVEDDLREAETLNSLQLVICEPNYVRTLDTEYFSDDLPEDCDDLPDSVYEAIDTFNEAVKGVILSWSPGKCALETEIYKGGEK